MRSKNCVSLIANWRFLAGLFIVLSALTGMVTAQNPVPVINQPLAPDTVKPAQAQHGPNKGHTRYTVLNLGTFGGTSGSSANGINARGWVIGQQTFPNGDQHAFLWVTGHKTARVAALQT